MRSKHLILLLLIPLSEIKAIFYTTDIKVSWYLFSDNKKFLCNVIEDYSNIIIIGVVFYFLAFLKNDSITKKIALFLFIINALDFVFLGLMDNAFYLLKIPLSIIIYAYASSKMAF
jgi:hypothetical protein